MSVLAFPLGITSALGLSLGLPALGLPATQVLFSVLLSSLCWVWLAEWLTPYQPTKIANGEAANRDHIVDGTSMAVMMAVVDPLLKAFWPIAMTFLWESIGRPSGATVLDAQTSIWVKLPLALLVAGLGEYWLHRLSHHWPPLWGFHALHHSAEKIYWLNGFRSHPVNIAWHQMAGYAVLLYFGIANDTLLAFSAISISVAAFQHANAKLRFGMLNHVFSTNELHRWHHDSRPGRSQVNYGSVLSIWDQVFGTFHLDLVEQPGRPGLEPAASDEVPKGQYWAQVAGPLRRFGTYASGASKDTS